MERRYKKELASTLYVVLLLALIPHVTVTIEIFLFLLSFFIFRYILKEGVYSQIFVIMVIFSLLTLFGLPEYLILLSLIIFLIIHWIRGVMKKSSISADMSAISLSILISVPFIGLYGLQRMEFVFLLSVIGTVVGILFSTLSPPKDYGWTIPTTSCFAMWSFYALREIYSYPSPPIEYVVFALVLMVLIGYLSNKARLMDSTGVHSSILIGLLVMIFSGWKWFLVLLSFFILGGLFTRYKYDYKASLGIAEKRGGRDYSNTFGNGLSSTVCAIGYGICNNPIFLIAFLGCMATAAGDTMASEIGETYKGRNVLITNFKRVPPGTNGGITILGELSALLGIFIIYLTAFLLNLPIRNFSVLFSVILGGFIGVNFDSLLGATLEGKYLNNSLVNLLATSFGGLISVLLYYHLP
ncbi:MAG: hypothetical protein MOIL_00176 [Candidatus Methanolliviera sp. GoM_oil]|nr:MAG: hypothetical protein MOIL_00176 [Candidatus Methanolliviera sp. GoM_oil]